MFSPQLLAVRQVVLVVFAAIFGLGDALHLFPGNECCGHSLSLNPLSLCSSSLSGLIDGDWGHHCHGSHEQTDLGIRAQARAYRAQAKAARECAICKLLATPVASQLASATLSSNDVVRLLPIVPGSSPRTALDPVYNSRGPPSGSL